MIQTAVRIQVGQLAEAVSLIDVLLCRRSVIGCTDTCRSHHVAQDNSLVVEGIAGLIDERERPTCGMIYKGEHVRALPWLRQFGPVASPELLLSCGAMTEPATQLGRRRDVLHP